MDTSLPFGHSCLEQGLETTSFQGGKHLVNTGGANKSLARPTSRCILFEGENIPFDASLVIYIYIVLIFLQL
jgi:hypothetical protein